MPKSCNDNFKVSATMLTAVSINISLRAMFVMCKPSFVTSSKICYGLKLCFCIYLCDYKYISQSVLYKMTGQYIYFKVNIFVNIQF